MIRNMQFLSSFHFWFRPVLLNTFINLILVPDHTYIQLSLCFQTHPLMDFMLLVEISTTYKPSVISIVKN